MSVSFTGSCGTKIDCKKFTGEKMVKSIKRSYAIRRLICLNRQPAILANQPRELAVSANLGQLRNQQRAGTHQ
jgi:hypothetical protein